MNRPSSGSMVYWRLKRDVPSAWNFGYVSYERGHDLLRMGRWNGDTSGGSIVSAWEIEWQPYKR